MKRKIELDELDKKCLEEMPLLLDIISSTANKVNKSLLPYYNDLHHIISTKLKGDWVIHENSSYTYKGEILGDIKDKSLQILSSIHIVKDSAGIVVDFFYCQFGYTCGNEEDAGKYFSFYLLKDDLSGKRGSSIQKESFYKELKESLSYDIDYCHSDKGDETEYIEIKTVEISEEKIETIFEIFKSSILIPFIKKLK